MSDECDACRGTVYPESPTIVLCRAHFEARETDGIRQGMRTAVRWIREMPRREIETGRVRIGWEIYQRVAMSIARHIEDRDEASQEVTRPSLPDSG